ncbi:MAG: sigma-54-dependent Fis family transcriptional regulator [Deltaproteobacteria bacterium]|nr:sigma-54-dependent Fis family transcriptional regulator [Deltaproteobacteria bacterium]
MAANILLIDDEENIRFTLNRFLQQEGYNVWCASDCDQALEIIDSIELDVIFADVILKGRTGIEILDEVKKRNMLCPVVIFTGAPNIETASDAVRLGAFDYLPKPIRQDTLLHVASKALRHKKLAEEKEKYRLNLEAIFRSVKDAIVTVDQKLLILQVNGRAGELCGITRESAVGNAFDSFSGECSMNCLESLKTTIREHRSLEVRFIECERKSRPQQTVNIRTYPLVGTRNKVQGAVLVIRDETRLVHLERELEGRSELHGIIGKSPQIQEIYDLMERLKDVRSTLLISGESGTGKGMVARTIHRMGTLRGRPFVSVNCSALPETLLESELFGHVSGAFTGATKNRMGRFQKAEGGTIFLDEIGETTPHMQLRLLHVLQDGEFERVGDSTPVKVNVRVIAATNKDLNTEIEGGRFREDLYYRLRVVEIELPPLRERKEDIPLLVDHFLEKLRIKLDKQIASVSEDVLETFIEYPWPGNVRELEHSLEHAFILCREEVIETRHLPAHLRKFGLTSKDREHYHDVVAALEKARWNKTKAAAVLGISRQELYRKLKRYKIV